MADEQKSILINIDVNSNAAKGDLVAITQALEVNKKAITALNSEYKNGEKSVEQYSKELVNLQQQQRELVKEQQVLKKEYDAENNSIDGLRAKLARLVKDRNSMDTSLKGNAKRFDELQKEILQTNEALKGLEQSGGDFRRNVGNYSEAMKDFQVNIGGVGVSFNSAKKAFDTFQSGATQLFSSLRGGTQAAQGLQGVMATVPATNATASASFYSLGAAIISSGVGAIVIAIGVAIAGMAAAIKTSDNAATQFDATLEIMGKLLKVVFFSWILAGKVILEVSSYLIDATEAANNFTAVQDAIHDANVRNAASYKAEENAIEQTLIAAKNKALSDEERLKLIDEATKKEESLFAKRKAYADAELANSANQYAQSLQNQADLTEAQEKTAQDIIDMTAEVNKHRMAIERAGTNITEEELKYRQQAIADHTTAIINKQKELQEHDGEIEQETTDAYYEQLTKREELNGEHNSLIERANNRREGFEKEIQDETTKNLEKNLKARYNLNLAYIEKQKILNEKAIADQNEASASQVKAIEQQQQLKLNALYEAQQQELNAEGVTGEQKLEINQRYEKERQNLVATSNEQIYAINQESAQKEIDLLTAKHKTELNEINIKQQEELRNAELTAEERNAISAKYANERLQLDISYKNEVENINKELADNTYNREVWLFEQKKAIAMQELALRERNAKATIQLETMKLDEQKKINEGLLADESLSLDKRTELIKQNYNYELEILQIKQQEELNAKEMTEQEKQVIEEKYRIAKVDAENKANKEIIEATKKNNERLANLEKQKFENTVAGINALFSAAKAISGENKKAQKVIDIGQAISNTAVAIMKTLAQFGGTPLGYVQAGSVGVLGAAQVAKISQAAGGGEFVTNGKTLLMVGDNPSGHERVTVEPIGAKGKTIVRSPNLVQMAGGGTLTAGVGALKSAVSSVRDSQMQNAESMAMAISQMPSPVVSVKEINSTQNRVKVKQKGSSL
jgi:hypothetical protein